MDFPEDLRYTKEHEWIRVDGEEAVVGITDYAQDELGDITFIELPEAGKKLEKESPFTSIESVKAASDIFAPVSGEVIEVNTGLSDHPELINESPYDKGWIGRIRMADSSELEGLMTAGDYRSFVEGIES
jgi:glycine cleavage system H protein